MTQTMQAAVLHGVGDLRIEEVDAPGSPTPGQVRIRIDRVGICGSDIHYWKHGRIGDFKICEPMILGHECSGTVVEIGQNVTDLLPGDRVAIEPGFPSLGNAASHFYMKRGEYNLCPDILFYATPPNHGAFCQYINHPADFCFKLPENVSLEAGAMIEPLSTGIYASRVASIRMGDTIVITGAGPIGLMNVLTALASGATNVVVSDPVASRLEIAGRIGATHLVNGPPNELKDRVLELTGGRGADVCVEAAGHPIALNSAIGAARSGATIVLIGMPPNDTVEINVNDLIVREIKLRPVFRYNNTFPTGVQMLASGKINLEPLISKTFLLAEVPEAFDYVVANPSNCIKAMINVSGSGT